MERKKIKPLTKTQKDFLFLGHPITSSAEMMKEKISLNIVEPLFMSTPSVSLIQVILWQSICLFNLMNKH